MKRKLKFHLKTNSIVCGDCEEWLKFIPNNSIDLIYIDPPFFSNKNYEIVWGNGFEVRSFGDRFSGGIRHYIEWMRPKIKEAKRVLKDTGSIVLHCDKHAGHRIRCLLDDVFGEKNFMNEIIWQYDGLQSPSKKKLSTKHDNIFRYSKKYKDVFTNEECLYFDKKLSLKEVKEGGYQKDNKGYFYTFAQNDYTNESIKRLEKENKIHYTKTGKPRVKYYLKKENDLSYLKRTKYSDVWNDINSIGRASKDEKIGYKTQKPEALIERIVNMFSNKNDLVLDFFGGGGTTSKVCADLNRQFIIGDVSPVAVRLMANRLISRGYIEYDVKSLPQTKEEYLLMGGHKFADMICEFMGWESNPKKSGDGGIDGWANRGKIPVQIKNHRKKIGRPDVQKFLGAITDYDSGIFVAWNFSPSAYEYKAKIKDRDIVFIEVEEIIGSLLLSPESRRKHQKLYEARVKKDKLQLPRPMGRKEDRVKVTIQ